MDLHQLNQQLSQFIKIYNLHCSQYKLHQDFLLERSSINSRVYFYSYS